MLTPQHTIRTISISRTEQWQQGVCLIAQSSTEGQTARQRVTNACVGVIYWSQVWPFETFEDARRNSKVHGLSEILAPSHWLMATNLLEVDGSVRHNHCMGTIIEYLWGVRSFWPHRPCCFHSHHYLITALWLLKRFQEPATPPDWDGVVAFHVDTQCISSNKQRFSKSSNDSSDCLQCLFYISSEY